MPIACDPAAIAEASKCFCMSEPASRAAMLYLLAQIAGDTSTPAELAAAARGYLGTPENVWRAEVSYLLCQIASSGGV